jgi:hypothetical protein
MRNVILIVTLLIITLSSGCINSSTEPDNEYRKGTEGIDIRFMENMPPSQVYDNAPIDLVVEVRNKGAYPQPNRATGFAILVTPNTKRLGTLYLDGFENKIIMGMPRQISIPEINGKSPYNPEGEYDIVTFHGNIINLDSQDLPDYNAEFMVTSCYNYQTIAAETICIDPEPYSIKQRDKVCTIPSSYSFSGGQGGPVAVTDVREEVYGNKVMFTITVKNLGDGKVVDKNKINTECPYSLDHTNLNIVYVSGKVSGYNLVCNQNGKVMLSNDKGMIICQIPKPSTVKSAYTTPLQVNLDYGYTSSISKSVKIINTP